MDPDIYGALRAAPEILALLSDPGRDLLAVTDKYPPDHVGGAEVSLHILLRQPRLVDRVVVVLFSHAAPALALDRRNGVPVLTLPDAAAWPLQRRGATEYARARAGGSRARLTFEWSEGARFLMRGPAADFPDRASALWFELRGKPRGGIVADFSMGERAEDWERAAAVRAVVRLMVPRAALLDNCRSVLLASPLRRAAPDLRIVSMVRDNRFHCARHDQSLRVAGVACETCRFECAAEDAGASRLRQLAHRRHLAKSLARRRASLAASDVVAVTSRYLEAALAPVAGPAKLRRVPNPADDLEAVSDAIRGVAERPGANVVVVGMLNEAKGQLRFLRETADWLRADPARALHFAGRGDAMAAEIRAFAAEAGLTDQVILHGFLPRRSVLRLMRECQVVAAPTVWPEPFGRTPLEAGRARAPTVAFATGGLAETILDGETGFLVAPGDYRGFIDRIERLMADPALRRRMGAAAALHVARSFSATRSARMLETLLAPEGAQSVSSASRESARQPERS